MLSIRALCIAAAIAAAPTLALRRRHHRCHRPGAQSLSSRRPRRRQAVARSRLATDRAEERRRLRRAAAGAARRAGRPRTRRPRRSGRVLRRFDRRAAATRTPKAKTSRCRSPAISAMIMQFATLLSNPGIAGAMGKITKVGDQRAIQTREGDVHIGRRRQIPRHRQRLRRCRRKNGLRASRQLRQAVENVVDQNSAMKAAAIRSPFPSQSALILRSSS